MSSAQQSPSGTVLVVDDDPHIRDVLRFALAKAGFDVVEAGDGAEALERFESVRPDALVLDVLMPGSDGIEVCRRLRARSDVPIVFLSSRDDEVDRIVGLELGGDDYVTKPFSPRELVARVRAVLRRSSAAGEAKGGAASDASPRVLEHGRLRLDADRHEVRWDGRLVELTATEHGVLRTLLGFPGKVYTRDEFIDAVWGHGYSVSYRTVDSHVRRVRQKIAEAGGQALETVHGVGYKLGACR
jgi:two-component system, OmpR family, response regulator